MWQPFEPLRHKATESFISVALCLSGLFLVFFGMLSACAPTPQPEQVMVTAYATSAAAPWLAELYSCAENTNAVVNVSAESPDIFLLIGELETLLSHAYQIGEEEILIVAGNEGPLAELTLEEAQILFARGSSSAQVWVYPSDADMQIVFNQLVMNGRSVTSFARVAVSPQDMSDVLKSESTAIGILPRHWVKGDVREVFSVGHVPVLAGTKEEPQGVILELVSCLQRN